MARLTLDQANRLVNNIDVTVDTVCGASASALPGKPVPESEAGDAGTGNG